MTELAQPVSVRTRRLHCFKESRLQGLREVGRWGDFFRSGALLDSEFRFKLVTRRYNVIISTQYPRSNESIKRQLAIVRFQMPSAPERPLMSMRFLFTYTTFSSILRYQVVSDLALRNGPPQTILD